MKNRIMKKYALTEYGARGFIQAVIATVAVDLALMFPVSALFFLAKDLLSGNVPGNHIIPYQIGLLLCLVLIFLTSFWQYNSLYYSTYKESGNRRIALSEKLRKLPLSFFGKKDLSDLTTVILGDCTAIEHAFSHQMPQFYGSMISTVIIAVGLLCYNWRLGLAALWPLPISLLIVAFSKSYTNRIGRKHTQAKLDLEDGIQEFIECARELRMSHAQGSYLDGLKKKVRQVESRAIESEFKTAIYVVSAQMLLKFGIATVALVGGAQLIAGRIDVLTFFAFLITVSRIYEPMSGNLINLAAVNALQINIDRMNEINEQKEQSGKTEFNPKNQDIEFSHVSFGYSANDRILKDVSFTAKQGEVTALVGSSGGGKSTVSRLAARFWDVDDGRITLGGTDISTVEPETLLKCYSIVFQDVTLFNNSILENIRIGRENASDEEVMAAGRLANVDEFADRLADGWNTQIGENGANLSGGERQRISIARAFLKDAPIILLDEATASLDVENETKVQSALSRLIKDKTVIVIAHRMRTVSGADKVVVLSEGTVAEQGSPAELLSRNGIFAEMVKLQTQGQNWMIE